MKKKLLEVLGVGLSIIGLILLVDRIQSVPSKQVQTLVVCKHVDVAVRLLEDLRSEDIVFGPDTSSVLLNTRLGQLSVMHLDADAFDREIVSADGVMRDSWGNPLQFCTVSSTIFEELNPQLKKNATGIAFWSIGENGENELGYGDDIFAGGSTGLK